MFAAITLPIYSFVIRDEWDNGEFMTGATVDLLVVGVVTHSERFVCSSEDPYGPLSAYGNGRDNHAGTQARSFAWAWLDSMERPYSEAGPQYDRPEWFDYTTYPDGGGLSDLPF